MGSAQLNWSADILRAERNLGGPGAEMGGVQSGPGEEGPSSVGGQQSGSFLLTVTGGSPDPFKTHQRLRRTQATPVASQEAFTWSLPACGEGLGAAGHSPFVSTAQFPLGSLSG